MKVSAAAKRRPSGRARPGQARRDEQHSRRELVVDGRIARTRLRFFEPPGGRSHHRVGCAGPVLFGGNPVFATLQLQAQRCVFERQGRLDVGLAIREAPRPRGGVRKRRQSSGGNVRSRDPPSKQDRSMGDLQLWRVRPTTHSSSSRVHPRSIGSHRKPCMIAQRYATFPAGGKPWRASAWARAPQTSPRPRKTAIRFRCRSSAAKRPSSSTSIRRTRLPGCTVEACTFRDSFEDFVEAGAVVIGVSQDSEQSHKSFATHHRLPFLLVSDRDKALQKAYGVPQNDGPAPRSRHVRDRSGRHGAACLQLATQREEARPRSARRRQTARRLKRRAAANSSNPNPLDLKPVEPVDALQPEVSAGTIPPPPDGGNTEPHG